MSDDNKFDDQFFDDEDAAFEEEFGELDIDEEESLEDEFSDEYDDDEWGDGEEGEDAFDGADLVADNKKGLPGGLDFNKIVIIGALLVGGGVMAFQVMTSKPQVVDNVFRSSVNMQGASDGVVFGDNHFFRGAKHCHGNAFKLNAQIFANHLAAGKNGNVF